MRLQRKQSTCYVSFNTETNKKIDSLARKNNVTKSQFIRWAVLNYIKHQEKSEASAEQRELQLADQLKKATNRICALLAKAAIDVNSVARYIYETVDDEGKYVFHECHEKAVKRVQQRLSKGEQMVVDGLTQE